MLKSTVGILASVALFCPAVAWLYATLDEPLEKTAEVAQHYILSEYVLPEKAEQASYVLGLLLLPAGIFCWTYVSRNWRGDAWLRLPVGNRFIFELTLAVLLLGVVIYAFRNPGYCLNPLFHRPWASLPQVAGVLAALALITWLGRVGWWLAGGIVTIVVGHVFLTQLMGEKAPYAMHPHFSAMFYPVVEVCHGKAVLVDIYSQYGLYPHFLLPIFAMTGLTVFTFTTVMATLTAAGFMAIWRFFWESVASSAVAILGMLALVFNSWFIFVSQGSDAPRQVLDNYFQYYPIRFIFPACMVLLAWWYFRYQGRTCYWAAMLVGSFGVLWNTDSGLPAVGAWCLALCYGAMFAQGWRGRCRLVLGHLLAAAISLTAVVGLHTLLVYLASGSMPDYVNALAYQRMFYGDGFFMLPMPLLGAWLLPVLVYLAALALAAHWLLIDYQDNALSRMMVMLSVLGLGLFSYYQGRSHVNVLKLAWWPCFLLLPILLEQLLPFLRSRVRRPLPWLAAAAVVWLLLGSATGLLQHIDFLYGVINNNMATLRGHAFADEAKLVRRCSAPGESILALTDAEALFHLVTGAPSPSQQAILQMLLVKESQTLQRQVDAAPGQKVYVSRATLGNLGVIPSFVPLLLNKLCRGEFEVIGETRNGYLFARSPLLLSVDQASLLHVGFRATSSGLGHMFPPITLPPEATLEVVFKAASEQPLYANLLSNHPGTGLQGMAIERQPGDTSRFGLMLGDGRQWHCAATFALPIERWSHIALVLRTDVVEVYVDGALIARSIKPRIEDSSNPIMVGNWIAQDRPFQGAIREVRMLGRALTLEEIEHDSTVIKVKLQD